MGQHPDGLHRPATWVSRRILFRQKQYAPMVLESRRGLSRLDLTLYIGAAFPPSLKRLGFHAENRMKKYEIIGLAVCAVFAVLFVCAVGTSLGYYFLG